MATAASSVNKSPISSLPQENKYTLPTCAAFTAYYLGQMALCCNREADARVILTGWAGCSPSSSPALVLSLPAGQENSALKSSFLTEKKCKMEEGVLSLIQKMVGFRSKAQTLHDSELLRVYGLTQKSRAEISARPLSDRALIALIIEIAASTLSPHEQQELMEIDGASTVLDSQLLLAEVHTWLWLKEGEWKNSTAKVEKIYFADILREAHKRTVKEVKEWKLNVPLQANWNDLVNFITNKTPPTTTVVKSMEEALSSVRKSLLVKALENIPPAKLRPAAPTSSPSRTPSSINSRKIAATIPPNVSPLPLNAPANTNAPSKPVANTPKQPIGQPVEMEDAGIVYKGMRYSVKDLQLSEVQKKNSDVYIHNKSPSSQIIGLLLRDGAEVWVSDFAFGLNMVREILSGRKQIHTMKGMQNITQMPKDIYVMDASLIVKMAGWATKKK